jgi:hypothetical protein
MHGSRALEPAKRVRKVPRIDFCPFETNTSFYFQTTPTRILVHKDTRAPTHPQTYILRSRCESVHDRQRRNGDHCALHMFTCGQDPKGPTFNPRLGLLTPARSVDKGTSRRLLAVQPHSASPLRGCPNKRWSCQIHFETFSRVSRQYPMRSARISDRQTHLQIMSFVPGYKDCAETMANRVLESEPEAGRSNGRVKREGQAGWS